jgi:hypothetical protein
MKTTLTTEVVAQVAAATSDKKCVWFQNYSDAEGIYVFPVVGEASNPMTPEEEFFLPPADSATKPSTLMLQATGGDSTLVNREWRAYQESGGDLDIFVGKW